MDAEFKITLLLSPLALWNVIVFVAELPVMAGIFTDSLYVPSAILNTTGPHTPYVFKSLTAELKVPLIMY